MAATVNKQLKKETLVWTDDEVELLLRVTLDYKTAKAQEQVDWESCPSKYSDIMEAFQAQYPRHPTSKDFPHYASTITKAQLTAKIKNIRVKYRRAVDTGRRRGQGRVVLLFYELCEVIWGGSSATRPIETADLEEWSSRQTSDLSADSPCSSESRESPSPPVLKRRRDRSQAEQNGHKGDRRRRKLPADSAMQEDLRIKKRMLALMEESVRRNADNMEQMNTNIANITSTIQEGFSLMRVLLAQAHNTALTDHSEPSTSTMTNGTSQQNTTF